MNRLAQDSIVLLVDVIKKRWWQQLRVVNVIWISTPRNEDIGFSAGTICSGFDLSCCCVSLEVQFDMTSKNFYYYGSEEDLAKNTMCLMPCCFESNNTNVVLQMVRVLKYINRGFKLVGTAKDVWKKKRRELEIRGFTAYRG